MNGVPPETVQVLGVPVDSITEGEVLSFVADRVASRVPAQVVTINAEYVMRAQEDPEFLRVLREADLHTPDGAGVVIAARRRGLNIRKRVGGSDLIWSIAAQSASMGHRLFLLGGAPGVARGASEVLQDRFPDLILAGTHSGGPERSRDAEQIGLIRDAKPDVLLVAFGAPAQDLWIARLKSSLGVPLLMGVGGSFDYVAGSAKRAPLWMRRTGLEWLFRLIRQPWRWRRMGVLPRFAILAATKSN